MHIADFEPFPHLTYKSPIKQVLSIGWLDNNQSVHNPNEINCNFLDRLWSFCISSPLYMHQTYICKLCSGSLVRSQRYILNNRQSIFQITKPSRQNMIDTGKTILLGTNVFAVFSDDNIAYISPNLIYHYIMEHNYKPPEEFIQAVLISPLPETKKHNQMKKCLKPIGTPMHILDEELKRSIAEALKKKKSNKGSI